MRDPLIVDLDGDGIELISADASSAYFDYGGEGFAIRTGWVAPSDGILVRDLDQNSSITANEMFGATSGNALADLAAHDANADGKIDANDAIFSELKVWVDADGDGVGEQGELISLAQAGIVAIELHAQQSGQSIEGNTVIQTVAFNRIDGTTGTIAEVNFATDSLHTRFEPSSDFVLSSTAFLLPYLVGYGQVPDLIYSMSLRPELEGAVLELVLTANSMPGNDFDLNFEHVVQMWAGVDGVSPESQGPLINARHMAVVEAFYGISYAEMNGTGVPLTPFNASSIEATYQSIIDVLKLRFVSQISVSQILNGVAQEEVEDSFLVSFSKITFDPLLDNITSDFNVLVDSIIEHKPSEVAEQIGYFDLMARLIKSLRVDLFDENITDLIAAFKTAATTAGLSVAFQEFVAAEISASKVVFASESGAAVNGTSGHDVIIIDESGHTFSGGSGNDTYIYGSPDIDAEILDGGVGSPGDRLILLGINSQDVTVSRSVSEPGDLTLEFASGGSLVLKGQFKQNGWDTIEQIVFDNGDVWTNSELKLLLIDQASTDGDDTILGFSGDDILEGGLGNDQLSGGGGGDAYIYTAGDGDDVIAEGGIGSLNDTLVLHGIDPEDVTITQSVSNLNDIVLTFAGGGSVTLKSQLDHLGWYRIENINFDDETSWDFADLLAGLGAGDNPQITHLGTAASETINGSSGSDVIRGLAGDDTLAGGTGSDAYVYEAGDGNDVIVEGNNTAFDELHLVGLAPSDVVVSRVGTDLIIAIESDGAQITVQDHFLATYRGLESIKFGDGTVWDREAIALEAWIRGTSGNDTVAGFSTDDVLAGFAGTDELQGGSGSDIYMYGAGYGNDTITENTNNWDVDKIKLIDLLPADVVVNRLGDDLLVTIVATGERLTATAHFVGNYRGIEQLVFADGTIWDRATIQNEAIVLPTLITGTSAAETINGTSGPNIIDGLGGDDLLKGGAGGDTYIYRVGSGNDTISEDSTGSPGDKIKLEGLNISDVTLSRSGNHLLISINATGEQLKVQNYFYAAGYQVEQLEFADGTIWDQSQIQAAAWIRGTSGNDTINGTSGADTIDGGAGADTLNGMGGGDTYIYGTGSGNDVIAENSTAAAVDRVKLADLNASDVTLQRSGHHLFITINATGEQLKIQDHFYSTRYGIEQLEFADATVWDRSVIASYFPIQGTSGNDTLSGTSGEDVFIGGLGNDTLNSGNGADTFIYASGDGNDKIDEESASTIDIDVLKFVDLNASDISLTRSGNDLMVTVASTGHQIELDEQYWSATSSWGIDEFQFADGTGWSRDQIMQNAWWNGSGGNDTMSGWASYDNIDGGAGNDTINGNAGADRIVGGDGDDTLTGGAGDDTFIFEAGFGHDLIADFIAGGSEDVIAFDGVFTDYADVMSSASQSGNDVVIAFDANNSLTLQNTILANLEQTDFTFF